jgi:hypothetical protein
MIPPDEPENIKRIIRDKRDIKRAVRKPTITTSGERQRGSLRLRRRPDACYCCLPWSFWEY